jgi:transcriptional regulator of acetoin/glycerol metabolism
LFPEGGLVREVPLSSAEQEGSHTLEEARRRAEQAQIEEALVLSQGRIGEAAKRLGISRTTLWKRKKSDANKP